LQQDLFRRYKEQKDASQAQRAFRAWLIGLKH
jgi:hypothetical protein